MKLTEQDWAAAQSQARHKLNHCTAKVASCITQSIMATKAKDVADYKAAANYWRKQATLLRERLANIEWHLEQFEVTA